MRALWLLLLAASAGATPPCEELYRLGSATFDGDGVSLFVSDGDHDVWYRVSGGDRKEVARTRQLMFADSVRFGAEPAGFWADSRSGIAWYLQRSTLYRISDGGAEGIATCDGAHAAAEFQDGHWSVALTCDVQLWLYRDDGGGPRQLGQLWVAQGAPAMTEDAPGRYALFAGGRPISFEAGQFTVGDPVGEAPTSAEFANDGQAATLIALDGDYLVTVERDGASFAARRDLMPTAVRGALRLQAAERTRVVVDTERTAYSLRRLADGWLADRTVPLDYYSQVVDARGGQLAILDEQLRLQIDDGTGQTTALGPLGVADGRTGACCSFVPTGNPGSLLLLLPLMLLRRRR